MSWRAWMVILVWGLHPEVAAGAEGEQAARACLEDCAGSLDCERRVADCLLRAGQGRVAIDRLKALVEAAPERVGYSRLLAHAYHADGNDFWAQRTLQRLLDADEADCQSRSWLAWLHLQQGDLDLAREVLGGSSACPRTPADRGRWKMLEIGLARVDPAAAETFELESALDAAAGPGQLYPEDLPLYEQLRRSSPFWMAPLHVRAEYSLGYTSNASAGLPTTEGGPDADSMLMRMDLFGRFIYPLTAWLMPALELGIKGHYLDNFDYGPGSVDVRLGNYLDSSLRVGANLVFEPVRLFAGYRGDLFLMNRGDDYASPPLFFYEAHRVDLELEYAAYTFFLGAGRRIFRQMARSRTELDGGLGRSLMLFDRLHLLAAMSLRYYTADVAEYDQFGGTLLVVGRLKLPAGWYVRVGLTAGLDYYPSSPPADGEGRGGRDLLVKPSAGIWSPSWAGLRMGLSYEYSYRDSTAQVSYPYDEHRVLLLARYTLDLDPWAPGAAEAGSEHVPIPWGVGGGAAGLDEERIQDLLRQDEAARRGSSCVN
ncbi:MAG: hypothetical protein JXR96_00210 [Deltaproteobacteria bacterium]|nr:hypothetical protein [Deltaproteobacteria bacterium]